MASERPFGLSDQARAPVWRPVHALWWRELVKLSRQRTRLLAGLGQPLMYLTALGTGLNAVFERAGFGNYIVFLSPGIVAMAVMTAAFVTGISVLWDRKFGQLKVMMVTPVPPYALVVGRCLGAGSAAVLQGSLVLLVIALVNRMPMSIPALMLVLAAMLATGIIFSAIGIIFGSMVENFQTIQLVVNFVLMPLFLMSGALFPISSILQQPLVLGLIRANPAAYCVDALRMAMGQAGHFSVAADFIGIGASLVLGVVVASIAMAKASMD